MRATDLLESLDYISEDLLARSEQPLEQKRPWLRTAAAACLALLAAAGAIWAAVHYFQTPGPIPGGNPDVGVVDPTAPPIQTELPELTDEERHEESARDPSETTTDSPEAPTEEQAIVDSQLQQDLTPSDGTDLRVSDCFGLDGGAVSNLYLDLANSFTPNVLWDSVKEKQMPVYENMAYLGPGAPGLFLHEEEMDEIIQSVVDWLGAGILEKEVFKPSDLDLDDHFDVSDDTPVRMRITTTRGTLELQGDNTLTAQFDPPLSPFPDFSQQSFASRADTLLELTDHYSRHLNEALDFLDSAPSVALTVQGYPGVDETVTTCYAWQSDDGPDAVSSLVNHDLNRLELSIDAENRLTEIRYVNYPVVKIGDYETISYEQALTALEQGLALSLVSEDDVKGGTLSADSVADAHLTYLPTQNALYAMPFYCFLVEMEDQSDAPAGTVQYGQFYVPMLDPSVLEDYPQKSTMKEASIPDQAQEAESDIVVVEYRGMRFYPALEDIVNGVYRAPEEVVQDAGVDCPVSLDFNGKLYYAKSRFLEHSIFILYTDDSFDGEITVVKHQDKAVYDASYADYYHFGYEKITVNDIPVQVFGNAMACWEYDGYYYDLSAMGQEHIAIGVDLKALLPYFVGID